MKSQRLTTVENTWRDCYDLTFPLRGNGLTGSSETANSGQAKQAQILDITAADSANVLASNIMAGLTPANARRSEEHTSELQSLMRISYAVFCLKKKSKTRKLRQ